MQRKDCDRTKPPTTGVFSGALGWIVWLQPVLLVCVVSATPRAHAGSVRLWPAATVVTEVVRVRDVCELIGFDRDTERGLTQLILTQSPPPGGSRLIHLELLRTALSSGGANMATVLLGGATQCSVTRPSVSAPATATRKARTPNGASAKPHWPHRTAATLPTAPRVSTPAEDAAFPTLRQAVNRYLNDEVKQYGGTADVIFDRTSDQVLNLAGPNYSFHVRRRGGPQLGLVHLEVDVLDDEVAVQTLPLVVHLTMMRSALLARRSISQGATIRKSDVTVMTRSVVRLDKLGLDDTTQAVGQRARKFIPAGTLIDDAMIESVPLVSRGQLVALSAAVGGIRVVTTAKSAEEGLLGEVVRVRAVDDRHVEFDGVVVGPGEVEVGTSARVQRLAVTSPMGDRR